MTGLLEWITGMEIFFMASLFLETGCTGMSIILVKKVIAQLNLKEVIQNHTHPKHKNETQRISKIAHTIQ